MGKIKTIVTLLKTNPQKLQWAFMEHFSRYKISHLLSDRAYIKMRYRAVFGKKLNLKDPKTYNEKLNWLKLNDHNPEYCKLVDKYTVREHIKNTIGEEYLIPTFGIWDRFEDIDFNKLPDKFVLKCTHDSGSVVLCRDKKQFDVNAARKKLTKKLKSGLYWYSREWPYKSLKPRIIAEQYMEDEKTSELRDYKFFCFGGDVKALFIASERQVKGEEVKFDFFDENFNYLNVRQVHPNAKTTPEKPEKFEEMKALAKKLAAGFSHVRVDFYEVNGKVYFGELTFYHFAGLGPFDPEEWDLTMGNWLKLPK